MPLLTFEEVPEGLQGAHSITDDPGQHWNGQDCARHAHVQNENSSDKMTSTGFNVKRASSMGVSVSPHLVRHHGSTRARPELAQ
jgi:hypothetical protein